MEKSCMMYDVTLWCIVQQYFVPLLTHPHPIATIIYFPLRYIHVTQSILCNNDIHIKKYNTITNTVHDATCNE